MSTAMNTWLAEVKSIRDSIMSNRITTLEDPRAQQLIRSGHYLFTDNSETLSTYFGDEDYYLENVYFRHFAQLPACPHETPAWAQTRKVHLGSWPEIEIEHETSIRLDEFGTVASVTAFDVAFAEQVTDNNGRVWQAGEVLPDTSPQVSIGNRKSTFTTDYTDVMVLHRLGEAMLDLARKVEAPPHVLTRRTLAGEPELAGIGGGL